MVQALYRLELIGITKFHRFSIIMAPAPIDSRIVDVAVLKKSTLGLPGPARERLEKADNDVILGYLYVYKNLDI
jgi:hypothetical protein